MTSKEEVWFQQQKSCICKCIQLVMQKIYFLMLVSGIFKTFNFTLHYPPWKEFWKLSSCRQFWKCFGLFLTAEVVTNEHDLWKLFILITDSSQSSKIISLGLAIKQFDISMINKCTRFKSAASSLNVSKDNKCILHTENH